MYRWITSYLFNRRARVSVDGTISRQFLQRHGIPQGGVLWCSKEFASTSTYRMQQAADKLSAWADDWCVQVNTEKSSTTLFTLSSKQKASTINISCTHLTHMEEATYLGVTFDRRLTWKPPSSK